MAFYNIPPQGPEAQEPFYLFDEIVTANSNAVRPFVLTDLRSISQAFFNPSFVTALQRNSLLWHRWVMCQMHPVSPKRSVLKKEASYVCSGQELRE